MKLKFIAGAFILVFLFGCTKSELTGPFLGINAEEIKQLVGNENVEIETEYFYSNQVEAGLQELNSKCNNALKIADYGLITVYSGRAKTKIFVDIESQEPVCVIKEILESSVCREDKDCDDGLNSTIDRCNTSIKQCVNERISECKSRDNYCPSKCIHANDNDCLRECFENNECDDSNSLTDDTCYATTQSCLNVPVPWINDVCIADADCDDESVCTDESCVEGLCKRTNHTNGEICEGYLECYNGVCEAWATHPLIISEVNVSYDNNYPQYPKYIVSWKTNKLANSEVRYGILPDLQLEVVDYLYDEKRNIKDETLIHAVELSRLKPEKEYIYKAISVAKPHRPDPEDREQAISELSLKIKFKTCQICDDKDICTEDTCNLKNGVCVYAPIKDKTGCK